MLSPHIKFRVVFHLSYPFYVTDSLFEFEQHYQRSNQCSAETAGIQQILLNHITQELLPAICDKCLYLRKEYIMLFMPVSLHHMEKVLLQIMNQKAKQQEGRKEKSRQQQERWRGEEKCDGKK